MKITPRLLFFILILIPKLNFAKVDVPAIFSDNMVLQRNAEVNLWGWAKPGEKIQINLSWTSEKFETKPNYNGLWQVKISTNAQRGNQTIKIKGYNEIVLNNILLGEVWLISGQSNMEWSAAAGIEGGEEAIKNATNDEIRFFSVNHRTAEEFQNDLSGKWLKSNPESMQNFSAVAYFFAKKMNEDLDVPIGLVNATWGGTPAEPWMPAGVVKSDSLLSKAAKLLPETEWGPNEPGLIYNAMINPLKKFKFSGVLWYQGESNTPNADYYEVIFSSLIKSWRNEFQEELPFYFAQIAPFNYEKQFAGVKIREAQRRTLKLPKTAMVITSDIGNRDNIHPKNKKEVGLRFANLVQEQQFGRDKKAGAPLIQSAKLVKNGILLTFKNAEGLSVIPHSDSQFEVSEKEGDFQKVDFKLKGNKVFLEKGSIENPVYVRFSWRNTAIPNISNGSGLPASSFCIEIE